VRTRCHPFWIVAAACLCLASARAAEPLPPEVRVALAASGLPLKSFGFYAQPVDTAAPATLAALNADQPFLMASTTKLITSLAALDLLGPTHRWRTQAFATGPVVNGRLQGDLVLMGQDAGLTPAELSRWFKQMRGEGLSEVSGRIVLERLTLLHDAPAAQTSGDAVDPAAMPAPAPQTAMPAQLVVAVRPAAGEKAAVALRPQPPGVLVINDVFMGDGCSAWAQWTQTKGAAPALWVRGQWEAGCGARDVAYVKAPPAAPAPTLRNASARNVAPARPLPIITTPRLVASLWAETGGRLRGGVVDGLSRVRLRGIAGAPSSWSSELTTPLPDVIREMNKNSNNVAARNLLLSLSEHGIALTPAAALRSAQDRVNAWLIQQGLADGDIRIDIGSGQSRNERGKPRALVRLLQNAWRTGGAQAFVESLPIAGVDGTLAHRLRNGQATGQAFLKTGTLSDTRALAGYVRGKSGKVYAVAAMVNHPDAARGTPALDALIEWIAKNG